MTYGMSRNSPVVRRPAAWIYDLSSLAPGPYKAAPGMPARGPCGGVAWLSVPEATVFAHTATHHRRYTHVDKMLNLIGTDNYVGR